MRWVTYRHPGGTEDRTGLLVDNHVHGLPEGTRLVDLLGSLEVAASQALATPDEITELTSVDLRPPIPTPPAIRDFSSFYDHHNAGIRAIGQKWDDAWFELPFFYFSNPNTMLGDGEVFEKPLNSHRMDYELEICCVIGRACKDVSVEEAEAFIAGYSIFNDWSARDLQSDEMARAPVGPAKGKDSANSMGPWLVTVDEIDDRRSGHGFDLKMTARVNGTLYSEGNWATVHWSMAEHVAYASRNTTLVPGDVLCTGTVGTGCILELAATGDASAYPWLEAGDIVEFEVERLGKLRNRVADGQRPHPIRGRINGSRAGSAD